MKFVPFTVLELSDFIRQRKADAFLIYETYWKEEEDSPSFCGDPGILWQKLRRQDACIAMPREHPMAGRDSVELRLLRKEKFIVNYDISRQSVLPGHKMHEGFLKSCEQAGFTPFIVPMEGSLCANLRNTAVVKYGYLYPTFLCPCLQDKTAVSYVPIQDSIYYSIYYFVWVRNEKEPIARELAAYFSEKFSQ